MQFSVMFSQGQISQITSYLTPPLNHYYQQFLSACSFAEVQSEKQELEKKYIHVMQILDSEKTAKWQLLQQCEEQGQLVSNLKTEVCHLFLSLHRVICLFVLTHLGWLPKCTAEITPVKHFIYKAKALNGEYHLIKMFGHYVSCKFFSIAQH